MGEHLVEDPVFRTRYRFRRSTDPGGGEVQHVEMWIDPDGGVTPHIHHAMEERFTVRAGRAEFLAGRTWISAGPGETIIVPAGTRHAFRNRGDEVAQVACEARPPSTLQAFLEDVAGLSRAGKLTSVGLPTPSGVLEAAVLIDDYREMVHLLFPAPPRPVQRLLFGPLARLARHRGHRSGEFATLA
ncbi:MAG: cupin domain-containing protein [Solirubrobacterales bacterium]|nr:cupin domain-containing protein [Solirubrobacterales bacterium]